jgi:peptidoglycan/xylan/chitin deacetylase (PgdA/CDA1 family)
MKERYSIKIPHGIMFHHFYDSDWYKSDGAISQEDLEKLLQFIGIKRIVDPLEWIKKIEKKKLSTKDICLTFDDGLLSQFKIALPVLDKLKIKAFWFIYSNVFEGHLSKFEIYRYFRYTFFKNIDEFYSTFFNKLSLIKVKNRIKNILKRQEILRYKKMYPFYSLNDIKFRLIRDYALTKDEYENIMDQMIKERGITLNDLSKNLWMSNKHLKELIEKGHMIGLHSYSHPMNLGSLTFEEQWREYKLNYDHIKEVCGTPAVAAAYPANSYNRNTFKILKLLNVKCGFRSTLFPPEGKKVNPNCYEIAREDAANILRLIKKLNL